MILIAIILVKLSLAIAQMPSLSGLNYSSLSNYTLFPKGLPGENQEYDFIIIGGGSAGSVIANRLSEVGHWKILLIEAGGLENFFTDIPAACTLLQLTEFDWQYKMEKLPEVCMAMENQQCLWPRGKVLGGSSVINYMMYTRGNKYDFERWEKEGNPGWLWKDVLPYYIKSEKANLKHADPGAHGIFGYLSVEDVPYQTPLVNAFLEAGRETGRKIIDYNGDSQWGFSQIQGTIRSGKRCSAAKAFLEPIILRPNLKILIKNLVTKILIDPKTKTAYGVEFEDEFKLKHTALAKKEVILSAGVIGSPQLLILSGVGPKNHLIELDIPVIQDLQVGQNLHDHLCFVGLTFLINETASYTLTKFLQLSSFIQYFSGKGPLTTLGGVEALGFIKTNVSKDPRIDFPDVELVFVAGSLSSDAGVTFRKGFGISKEFYKEYFEPISQRESWSIFPVLLHPKSTGYLRLRSKNISDHPILHGNYYTDPEQHDVRTMVAAVKEIIRLSETKAFQRFGSKLYDTPFPTCKSLKFGTDEYWECCVRSLAPTLHHQVGTCKMGPRNDSTAVVGSQFRVHGIKNLRVADSSTIPFALSAHTNAPAMMIGERVSDFIKNHFKNETMGWPWL
ncbi:glucose dehydrogenase [FAD, quinone]-like [Chrysoperla carnea]|uniref:glucose dehydrogenase [FAD, quinone]-like n=1 Tax=Chrysoperla carnea TaxID=189513 RepID=UPI001D08FD18|nr:glucose dehydrogenase [FAD, quinone]-like [Chrysoperla carnea]